MLLLLLLLLLVVVVVVSLGLRVAEQHLSPSRPRGPSGPTVSPAGVIYSGRDVAPRRGGSMSIPRVTFEMEVEGVGLPFSWRSLLTLLPERARQ